MNRSALAALMALCLAVLVPAQEYTLLAEDAAGLWGQADGTGCGNDIVKAAFAAAGAKATLRVMPYVRAKDLVLRGEALACFGMAWSAELTGKVVFPKSPIYTNTCTIFVRKADAARYPPASVIPPKTRVGTVRGYEYPPDFQELVRKTLLVPAVNTNEIANLRMLAAGRLDLVAANCDELKSAEYLLRQAGVADTVQMAFRLGSSGTFVGFAAGDPRTPAALKAFDAGMAAIRKDGTYDRILAAWKARL